jgi:Predicted transcriptional regulators
VFKLGLNEIIKIGNKIKSYRKKLGLTQADIAIKIEIPRSTYANYENNTREPDVNTLNKIAEVLGVPVNYLTVYFDKDLFAELVMNIKGSRTIEEYSHDCELEPDYILSIVQQKLDEAPDPETIKKLVNNVPEQYGIDSLDLMFAAGHMNLDEIRKINNEKNNETPVSTTIWSSEVNDKDEIDIEVEHKKDNGLSINVNFFNETFTQGDINSIIDFIASLHYKKKMKIKYTSVLKETENNK